MANETLKTIEAFYDNALKQLNEDNTYARLLEVDSVEPSRLQNSNNIYWRAVEQQQDIIEGWDLTGQEGDTIELGYPLQLDLPRNNFRGYRVDDLRDKHYMERASMAAAKRLNSDQNKRIADLVASTGSMYYESATAGFDFVAEADTLMTERQCYRDMGNSFFITPRAYKDMGSDLASRSDLSGKPLSAYETAMIGNNVAGFDVFRAPTYGTVPARVNATGGTVATDVVEVPESSTVVSGSPQNVDYRVGDIALGLGEGANFQVGDIITCAGVNALGISDKTDTNQLMTFRVVAINTDTLSVYPKPIAADQAGITSTQAAYANISTAIVTGMAVAAVNVTGGQANAFWANDSMCIVNGDAPLDLLSEFEGMQVVSETLDSGVKLYMAYDARLDSMQCRVRLFTWYGLVNKDPSRNGVAVYTG